MASLEGASWNSYTLTLVLVVLRVGMGAAGAVPTPEARLFRIISSALNTVQPAKYPRNGVVFAMGLLCPHYRHCNIKMSVSFAADMYSSDPAASFSIVRGYPAKVRTWAKDPLAQTNHIFSGDDVAKLVLYRSWIPMSLHGFRPCLEDVRGCWSSQSPRLNMAQAGRIHDFLFVTTQKKL
jgi:hypothetical protein